MVTVLMSACMPAPPPESDPAMIKIRGVPAVMNQALEANP
jgi:hypothetical protein